MSWCCCIRTTSENVNLICKCTTQCPSIRSRGKKIEFHTFQIIELLTNCLFDVDVWRETNCSDKLHLMYASTANHTIRHDWLCFIASSFSLCACTYPSKCLFFLFCYDFYFKSLRSYGGILALFPGWLFYTSYDVQLDSLINRILL